MRLPCTTHCAPTSRASSRNMASVLSPERCATSASRTTTVSTTRIRPLASSRAVNCPASSPTSGERSCSLCTWNGSTATRTLTAGGWACAAGAAATIPMPIPSAITSADTAL
ncbi:MAG: hypothetical protein M5U32_09885 [Myxococcota bacterium]|nr:hypothetical protein [Myxococcota bacterium]